MNDIESNTWYGPIDCERLESLRVGGDCLELYDTDLLRFVALDPALNARVCKGLPNVLCVIRGMSSHLVAGNARQVHRNDMPDDFV
jgi:hypothetical protein